MSLNLSPSLLDPPQITQRVFDSDNDAYRVALASGTSFAVSLDSSEDSITSVPTSSSTKATITNQSAIIISPVQIKGIKSANLFTNTLTTISSAQICTLQLSPSDTDDVWVDSTLTITPSTSAGTAVMGTPLTNVVARRARVKTAAAIVSGSYDIYLVVEGI